MEGHLARDSLTLTVVEAQSSGHGLHILLDLITKHKGHTGIVYCRTRHMTKHLSHLLQHAEVSSQHFHAGLTAEQRDACQTSWVAGNIQVIVATVAFGMGVNKEKVSFVMHWDAPYSIEAYQQEAGRAGRNNWQAECVCLTSATARQAAYSQCLEGSHEQFAEWLMMSEYLTLTEGCRHAYLARAHEQQADACETRCDLCLFTL